MSLYPSPMHRAKLLPMSPPLQALRQARKRADGEALLPGREAAGAYGDTFWREVARGVPGRPAAQCLDGYLASRYSTVARFSAGGSGRE